MRDVHLFADGGSTLLSIRLLPADSLDRHHTAPQLQCQMRTSFPFVTLFYFSVIEYCVASGMHMWPRLQQCISNSVCMLLFNFTFSRRRRYSHHTYCIYGTACSVWISSI
jgi:hypothetical protein